MLKRIAFLVLLSCTALATCCTITINSVQTCNSSGVVTPWAYNSPSQNVLVNWTVVGTPAAPYKMSLFFADTGPATLNGFTNTGFTGAGTFSVIIGSSYPSIFNFPVKVVVDPDNVAGNTSPLTATMTKSFRASWPSTAIANYNPQTLFGKNTMSIPVTAGTVGKLVLLLGKPVSDTFQTVVASTSGGVALSSSPTGYPVFETVKTNAPVGTYSISQTFQVSASSVACNPTLLNTVTWAQIDAAKATMGNYLGGEVNVEVTDPKIVAFTNSALPANYRTTLTPLAAAEKLFSAVVRNIVYQTPANGDAVFTLTNKIGDCGSMTNLYNACLRIVGIPCRTSCGWWVGSAQTHCWSEVFFPGVGWFPADTSLARKTSPGCVGLPYFAYAPSSNTRCSVCRTGTVITPDATTGAVQVGAVLGTNTATTSGSLGASSWTAVLSTKPIP